MDYDITDYDRIPNLEDTLELEENFEPRTSCVLLLDTSYSMSGDPITELNQGLQVFKQALIEYPLACRRLEVAILTFGGEVKLVQDFVNAEQFTPPTLSAQGGTPMGEAIEQALDRLDQRKTVLNTAGIPRALPWIFLITDGAPTDDWRRAAKRMQHSNANRDVTFFGVGVQGADMRTLGQITGPNQVPLKLARLQFRELFTWMSPSPRLASCSAPDTQVALPPPSGWAQGWGQVG